MGPGNLVRLASYITTFARWNLIKTGDKIGVRRLVYADTDSWTVLGEPSIKSSTDLGSFKI